MKTIIKVVCILLFVLFDFQTVFAFTDEIESVNDHLTVTPAKFEVWGDPGQTMTQAIKITNEENEPVILALSVEHFKVSQEDGSIFLQSSNLSEGDPLPRWISFEEKGMEFKAKESKIVIFHVDIPKGAKPGGHYASIVVSCDLVKKNKSGASATAKVVSLFMLSVTGDVEDKAKIMSLKANRLNKDEIYFDTKIINSGNNHIAPVGTFVISNLWGTQIDEIPLDAGSIIPKMNKRIITKWEPRKWLFGRYTVTLVSNYGHREKYRISAATTFWEISKVAATIFIVIIGTFIYLVLKYGKSAISFIITQVKIFFSRE